MNIKNAIAENTPAKQTLIVDSKKPKGKIIHVTKVKIADSLLLTDAAQRIFEHKIKKEILFMPKEHQDLSLVNCPNNGLIQTIQECYDNHRPLILSPDIIWLAICQGVAIHVNQNFDSLKNILFINDKPDQIVVRNDSLEKGAKHWAKLLDGFSEETKKYTKEDFYSFFVPEFSSTTPIEKTAYQVTLLETYKKGFQYVGDSGCGIPSITLKGKREDWQKMLHQLVMLRKIGLSDWAETLNPIIKEFVNVYDGKTNNQFWQNIYKNAFEYNAFYISGWIIKLFPYVKVLEGRVGYEAKLNADIMIEKLIPNKLLNGDDYLLSTLSTDNFPSGIAKINILWKNHFYESTHDMEVLAGFFAMKQYGDKSLEPFISWAICEKDAEKPTYEVAENHLLKLTHKMDYWSPNICRKVLHPAIYDIKRFKTQKESLQYIQKVIQDSIAANPQYSNLKLSDLSVKWVVLSNGSVGRVSVTGDKASEQLGKYIEKLLKDFPPKWFPALAHPSDVLDLGDGLTEEENKQKIRVNSEVLFIL
ncbi:MAG: DUF4419 domain-containing protein [Bacteroidales bacterium]|nr:DUF4419 domain-containing protein [Bacteroidales bacterium]